MLMISSHSVTRLSLEGTSINCTRGVQSLMYGLLSLANGLSMFGTLFQKMSISVHCCDLSAALFNVVIFLVLPSVFNSHFYVQCFSFFFNSTCAVGLFAPKASTVSVGLYFLCHAIISTSIMVYKMVRVFFL